MAFDPSRLNLIIDGLGSGPLRVFSYESNDDNTALAVAGYLTNAEGYGVRVGDFIAAFDPDGTDTRFCHVSSINASGHATLTVDSNPVIDDNRISANISGAPAAPAGYTLTAILDALMGSTRGQILARGASAWQTLSVGAANRVLKSDGTDPSYATITSLLDSVIGSSRGTVAVRGASSWQALTVGTAGKVLVSDGTDPGYLAINGSGALTVGLRQRQTSGGTFYIRDRDGNNNNNGQSDDAAGAWADHQGAENWFRANFDFSQFGATVHVRPGYYPPFISAHARLGSNYPNYVGPADISVTGAANNGSGLVRLTVTSTATLVTGDVVMVRGVTGTVEANNTPLTFPVWTITVIDGTHIDLVSSTFSNAYISGGVVVSAIIAATGDNQSLVDCQDHSVLGITNHGLFDGGFTGCTGLHARQLSILDWENITFGRIQNGIHIGTYNGASVNETGESWIIGNAAVHLQQNHGDCSLYISRKIIAGLTFSFFKTIYYGSWLTASGAIVYSGGGQGSATTGTKYLFYKCGVPSDGIIDSSWPGATAGVVATLDGPIGNLTPASGIFTTLTSTGDTIIGDGSSDTLVINAKSITRPNSPAFLAYNSATDSNATGDGTLVTVDFDTEVHDRGSDFASDTFTAPITGLYNFTVAVTLTDLAVGTHSVVISLITTGGNRTIFNGNPTASTQIFHGTIVGVPMTATHTASVRVTVSGGTKVVDVFGDGGGSTYFSGVLWG